MDPVCSPAENTRVMALRLSEFAAWYKNADTFETESKAQVAVLAKAGKEGCQVMFNARSWMRRFFRTSPA